MKAARFAVDAAGSAFVAGIASSSAFCTAGSPYQSRYRGGAFDGFVSKLNPAGTALTYSTLLGSSGDDEPTALAIDAAGSAYVTGSTDASDFPTTNGALAQSPPNPFGASFVTKLNPIGSSLTYSTYLGGNLVDVALGIAVDSSGSAYVVGSTGSSAFPRTQGVLQSSFGGALTDAFVSKLKPDGTALVYSTYLGGSDDDFARAVAVDGSGNAYVVGTIYSTNFPTAGAPFQAAIAGGSDAFVAKVNATGTALTYSTYLGGTQTERGNALALASPSNLYVAGQHHIG
jgi:Beta-propeller repeat